MTVPTAIPFCLTMTMTPKKHLVIKKIVTGVVLFTFLPLLIETKSVSAADWIEVTTQRTAIKDGDETLAIVSRGQQFEVVRKQGEWFLVQVPKSERNGWLYGPHVRESKSPLNPDPLTTEPSDKPNPNNIRLDEANELTTRVEVMIEEGRYQEALPLAKIALAIRRELLGKLNVETNRSLHYVALLQSLLGQFTEARIQYQEALEDALQIHGELNTETASIQFELGNVLRSLSEFSLAKKYLEKAAVVQSKVIGEHTPTTLHSVFRLAQVLHQLGNIDDASWRYAQALDISRNVLGNENEVTVQILSELGKLHRQNGDFTAAQPLLMEALQTRQKLTDDGDTEVIRLLTELGKLFESQNDHQKARQYYKTSLAVLDKMTPQDPMTTGKLTFRLAMVLTALGENELAQQHLEKTLALQLEFPSDNQLEPAATYFHLGSVLQKQAHLEEAKTHYQQAVNVWRRVGGATHSVEFSAMLLGLSHVHSLLGEHNAALAHYEETFGIYQKMLSDSHPDLINLLRSLGKVHSQLGNFEQSQKYLKQALTIAKANNSSQDTLTRDVLMDVAHTSFELGDYEGAHQQYIDLLSIREDEDSVNTLEGAMLLTELGKVLVQMDQVEQALEILNRAVSIKKERLKEHDSRLSESLLALARVCANVGDTKTAVDYVEEVRRSVRHHQTGVLAQRSPREQAGVLGRTNAPLWVVGLPFAYENRHDHYVVNHSAEWLLNGKGRSAEVHAGKVDNSQTWWSATQLREAIPADSILINIARFRLDDFLWTTPPLQDAEEHYVAWIIPATAGPPIEIVDLGPAEPIDRAVAAVRQELAKVPAASAAKHGNISNTFRTSLESLAKLIWNPLTPHIIGVQEILMCPDGALWHAPWVALPWGQWEYLVEVYRFRYLISGRELLSPPIDQAEIGKSVIIADPDYDLAITSVPSGTSTEATQLRNTPANLYLNQIERLSDTAKTAKRLGATLATYGPDEPDLLLAADATESRFFQVENPRILMLATHNFYPASQLLIQTELVHTMDNQIKTVMVEGRKHASSLSYSGLLMAGCKTIRDNLPTEQEDGLLTGLEIATGNLKGTDLVVLSACDTDAFDASNGHGVALLRQAFHLAGAHSVIATLWRFEDTETSAILNDFFKHLAAGQSKSRALQNAQLALVEAHRQTHGSAHPYCWAAFTITGRD